MSDQPKGKIELNEIITCIKSHAKFHNVDFSTLQILSRKQLVKLLTKYYGRCAQIPAIFENLIPRPEEKKDIFTDTPVFDD